MPGLDFFHALKTGATDVVLESHQCCSNLYFEAQYSVYVERLRDAVFFPHSSRYLG